MSNIWFVNLLLLFLIVSSESVVKNVLFVIVDDLRPSFGIYKGEAFTPNIDALSETGAVFQNAFAQVGNAHVPYLYYTKYLFT